jgi:hypothetical protein
MADTAIREAATCAIGSLGLDELPGEAYAVPAGQPEVAEGVGSQQTRLSTAEARQLRLDAAYALASRLHGAWSLDERLVIYGEVDRYHLALAAARWPELMPTLNGEFEWRALLMADLDED